MSTTMTVAAEALAEPAITTAQRHEITRIEGRFGRVEARLRRNGIVVVYVLGDHPELAFVQRGAQYQRLAWPHTIVALAPDGRPVWSMHPPVPALPTPELDF